MIAIQVINNNTPILKSVSVTTQPTKTSYYVGEKFEPNGMILTGTYQTPAGTEYTKIIQDYMYNQIMFPDMAFGATAVDITVFDDNESFTVSLPVTVNVPTFANSSWKTISEIAKLGLASTYYNLGDQKEIIINNQTYKVMIVDFNHDTPTAADYGQLTTGLTLQIGKLDIDGTEYYSSASPWSNTWNVSDMRTYHLGDVLYNLLPQEVQTYLVPVNKLYDNGAEIATISDTLFLPSIVEYLGDRSQSREGQGTQYAYYNGLTWNSDNNYDMTRSNNLTNSVAMSVQNGSPQTPAPSYSVKIRPMFCM